MPVSNDQQSNRLAFRRRQFLWFSSWSSLTSGIRVDVHVVKSLTSTAVSRQPMSRLRPANSKTRVAEDACQHRLQLGQATTPTVTTSAAKSMQNSFPSRR